VLQVAQVAVGLFPVTVRLPVQARQGKASAVGVVAKTFCDRPIRAAVVVAVRALRVHLVLELAAQLPFLAMEAVV
jgi:hypothetical protein